MTCSTEQMQSKARALDELLRGLGSTLIAYSGGIDSSYLASVALAALGADDVLAVIGRSASYPAVQREMAVRVAETIGLPYQEVDTHELESAEYVANSGGRCFHCKSELYGRLTDLARERGFAAVLDGSNADDLDDHRPGMAAARRLGVRSPLQEIGLSKAEIRSLARLAGLPNWEAPASPCLASRLAYGVAVTPERLRQVEEAEALLRGLRAWSQLRVRHHGDVARLEVGRSDLDALRARAVWDRVSEALRVAGFAVACLDLEGYRRGALNVLLRPKAEAVKGDRSDAVARVLLERGIVACVESAAGGDLAIVRPGDGCAPARLIERRETAVAACRAAGFRFAAVSLG